MGEHAGMRVLVTGGAGFIGSNVVDRLLSEGAEVTAVDNFDPFYPRARKLANLQEAVQHPGFRLEEVDIRDAGRVEEVMHACRPDVVVHLAARAGVRPSIDDP